VIHPNDEPVQPGSHVYTSEGAELGTVIRVEPGTLVVKKKGLLGRETRVPRALIARVEGEHVELSVPKQGLQA
jgi:hypothetical protein